MAFSDLLKDAQNAQKFKVAATVKPAASSTSVMSLGLDESMTNSSLNSNSLMLNDTEEEWTLSSKYETTEKNTTGLKYSDDKFSTVDEKRNVKIDPNQINLTQESNSQYIPFLMPRYFDGIDLMNMELLIYYLNADGAEGWSSPINVCYNSTQIKFGWVLTELETALQGKLTFEIHAKSKYDHNGPLGRKYYFKTKPNSQLEVLESLHGNGAIIYDETWSKKFLDTVEDYRNDAEQASAEASAKLQEIMEIVQNAESDLTGYSKSEVNYRLDLKADKHVVEHLQEDVLDNTLNISKLREDITTELLKYYTKEEVNQLFEDFDISDQLTGIEERVGKVEEDIANFDGLAALRIVFNEETKTLSFYNGEETIADIVLNISSEEDIANALKPIEEDLQGIHNAIDDLPNTLKNDYYTKTEIETELNKKADKTTTDALGKSLESLSDEVSGIDKSPRLTYDVAYNDVDNPDIGENVFVLYEIENEGQENEKREPKQKFTITGGSGGGGTSSSIKIGYVTTSPLVVTLNDKALITYTFSGVDSSGDAVTEGNATWKINGVVVATNTVTGVTKDENGIIISNEGINTFDVTDYLNIGSQKVQLSITDDAGSLATKSWTVQKVDVRLESSFNDTFTNPLGNIQFQYTPYGALPKTIHFILDGEELESVTTSASGIPTAYTLPSQTHGSHLLEVYMTAMVNGNTIESNHIFKDILWYDASTGIPVIGCAKQEFTATQYATTNIVYTVYDPNTETPEVVIAIDGNEVSTQTLERSTNTYPFRSDEIGQHIITITCGETVKTITANITELGIKIEPIKAGLVFDFNPIGKSNTDKDRLWTYSGDNGSYTMTVSNNFDWSNGGYRLNEKGEPYFCIKAGTTATIDYKMFEDDAKRTGKEMKLVFKTTNVQQADAKFLSCVDNTTGNDNIGIEMFAHEAFIYGSADKLNLKYSENDIIEFEFNITNNQEAVTEICGYEDGVATRHLVYDDSFNFTQTNKKNIVLGSDKCDLHIYRFKVYNTALTDSGILNNFIADARTADEMLDRHYRNQIYNENQEITPEILAEKCPWLHVYKLSAPYFTNNKSEKVPYTTIQQIYKDGDVILDNWTCYDCSHSGQGTSSNNYGAAGRNLDFIMNKSQREGVKPYFILGDGKTRVEEINLTRTSIPVAYLNFKANIASHNNFTNALLAKKYNEFNPYKRPFIREDESIIPYIKDTMEFYNAVVFIQETDTTVDSNGNYTKHREFNDTGWHLYSIGNIGDSKKTDKSRLTDPSDKYECIVEIMDVKLPLSDFPVDTMYNAMGYKEDETTKEKTYIWAKNENLGILYEKINGQYVLTKDTEVDLNKTYYVDILEHDDFSEDFTYGWRYLWEDGTDEENAEVFERSRDAWVNFYRFITTSTDTEFKEQFEEYFVKDSAIYDYLFTERYCMTDNRSKNCFFHLGKTGVYRKVSKPNPKLLHLYCEFIDSQYIPTTDININSGKTYYTQYAFDLSFDYDNDKKC